MITLSDSKIKVTFLRGQCWKRSSFNLQRGKCGGPQLRVQEMLWREPGSISAGRQGTWSLISLQRCNATKGLWGKRLASSAMLVFSPNTKMAQNVIDSFLLFLVRLKLTWLASLRMSKSFNVGSVKNHLLIPLCSDSKQNCPSLHPEVMSQPLPKEKK